MSDERNTQETIMTDEELYRKLRELIAIPVKNAPLGKMPAVTLLSLQAMSNVLQEWAAQRGITE